MKRFGNGGFTFHYLFNYNAQVTDNTEDVVIEGLGQLLIRTFWGTPVSLDTELEFLTQ